MRERYEAFTSLVININRYILKIKNFEMTELGLKGNQVQCLHYLYNEKNGLTAKQLSDLCQEDKAAISRTLKNLENSGLIYIDNEDDKKYRNPYKLTQKGQVCSQKIALKINDTMEAVSQGIDINSREILYSSLNTICINLKNICDNKGVKND